MMKREDLSTMATAANAGEDDDVLLLANQVEKTYPNGTHALDRVRLKIRRGDDGIFRRGREDDLDQ